MVHQHQWLIGNSRALWEARLDRLVQVILVNWWLGTCERTLCVLPFECPFGPPQFWTDALFALRHSSMISWARLMAQCLNLVGSTMGVPLSWMFGQWHRVLLQSLCMAEGVSAVDSLWGDPESVSILQSSVEVCCSIVMACGASCSTR